MLALKWSRLRILPFLAGDFAWGEVELKLLAIGRGKLLPLSVWTINISPYGTKDLMHINHLNPRVLSHILSNSHDA